MERKRKRFREWAITTVKNDSSIDTYIRNSMNNKIPKKLIELGEKENLFESIFEVTDIKWLENLSQDY